MSTQIQTDAFTTPPPSGVVSLPTSPTSRSLQNYAALLGTDIPDNLVNACMELFSTNYRVWGGKAGKFSKYTKPGLLVHAVRMILTHYSFTGQPVKMTGKRL
jgi:hypothetical protein